MVKEGRRGCCLLQQGRPSLLLLSGWTILSKTRQQREKIEMDSLSAKNLSFFFCSKNTKIKIVQKSHNSFSKFEPLKFVCNTYAAIFVVSFMRLATAFLICGATTRLLNLLMVLNCSFGIISSCD